MEVTDNEFDQILKPIGENQLFTLMDILNAIDQSNFDKGIGPDGFDGRALARDADLKFKIANELVIMLNNGSFPEYF